MRRYPDSSGRVERWSPDDLNFAIQQLWREHPTCSGERIVAAVAAATRCVRSARGRGRLVYTARGQLARTGHPVH